MPRRCVAGGCSNTNEGRFKLHKWPKRPEVARVWTAFVRKTRASWRKPTKWSHLCSAHFEEQCYETTAIARSCGIQPRLRGDASPTVRPKKATVVAKTTPSPHKRVRLKTKYDGLSGSAGLPVYVSPLDLLASADVSLTQQEENSKKLDPSFSTVFTSTPKLKKRLPGGRSAFRKRENTRVLQEIYDATATPVTTAGDGLDEYSLRADAGAEIGIQVRPDVNSIDEGKHDSSPSLRCKNSSVCVNNSETRGNLKTLPCSTEDGKSSCQLGSLKTHKGNHTGGTLFPCADCGKSCSCLSQLKIHQRIHTGEKPYHCSKCEKRFSRLSTFKIHQRVHTGEKPYHCNECEKRFSQLEHLKNHQRIHTGEKPHHCNYCGKRFTELGNLKTPANSHRTETTPL